MQEDAQQSVSIDFCIAKIKVKNFKGWFGLEDICTTDTKTEWISQIALKKFIEYHNQ